MLGMTASRASSSSRMLDSIGCSLKNFLTLAVIFKILSLLQQLHLQTDLLEGICIACNILCKDNMCACQWSDTGPPDPLVKDSFWLSFVLILTRHAALNQQRNNVQNYESMWKQSCQHRKTNALALQKALLAPMRDPSGTQCNKK